GRSQMNQSMFEPTRTTRPGHAVRAALVATVMALTLALWPGAASGSAGAAAHAASSSDNPLDLPVAPTNGNPLSGARFFVDHENAVSAAARSYPVLRVISEETGTARFGGFSGPDVGPVVHDYLARAARQEPGT